jgi:polyvinyl alcohol dehydrogenase (cytochrome)
VGHPTLYAFDAQTGRELWHTAADHQGGSDAVGSPVAYDGMVTVGISGTSAEGTDSQRAFIGSNVFIDAATGRILAKGYTIPEAAHKKGYAGGSIWSTMAIDPKTRYGYIGTGNPFSAEEYKTTNAIVKIDLHRDRPTFGQIVGSYKGNADHYFGELKAVEGNPACQAGLPATFEHPECLEVDLDFGAQPNIFRDSKGRLLVGDGQKSGVYHVADARTMKPVWTQEVGIFSAVGGIVGSAAFDGDRLYGPHTIGGYLWSLGKDDGSVQWVSPTADAVHWAEPVALANGILYTVDLKGFLDGYDAATGAPILHRPMGIGASTGADPTFSWGGTTVARHRVYASVGVGASSAGDYFPSMPNGFVIAFAPEA